MYDTHQRKPVAWPGRVPPTSAATAMGPLLIAALVALIAALPVGVLGR